MPAKRFKILGRRCLRLSRTLSLRPPRRDVRYWTKADDPTNVRANQLASFALLACLGSVQRTARTQLNQKTKKNRDKDTGKLAYAKVLSKPRPIAITIDSPTKTFTI